MYLKEHNCEERTGFPIEYYINLSGIKGIYPDFRLQDARDHEIKLENKRITIELETDRFSDFSRTIDNHQKIILNNLMVNRGKSDGGASWKVLQSQVRYAAKHNFDKLIVDAYRELAKNGDYIGYLLWCKYGYYMQDEDLKDFTEFMKKSGRKEKNLDELIATVEGQEFWKEYGDRWNGEFDLQKNSWSRKKFAKALLERRDRWFL
ncbi:hypothetical protein [Mucilaginibacter pedocola]|uniref:Uncharacterized protein n=1 Tax=Mucilaginibacter pedocola TaxID=1792845 RepID=A0A1S9P8R9_9SPHI|nr:hypothetical protein [Mucilaginibacter pedocola]OOQ57363.1 hypothetical protein BC343_14765 [Mucilaginibacter pedocola]